MRTFDEAVKAKEVSLRVCRPAIIPGTTSAARPTLLPGEEVMDRKYKERKQGGTKTAIKRREEERRWQKRKEDGKMQLRVFERAAAAFFLKLLAQETAPPPFKVRIKASHLLLSAMTSRAW